MIQKFLKHRNVLLLLTLAAGFVVPLRGTAKEPAKEAATFELGESKLALTAPAEWEKTKPKTRIVEHEFSVKSAKGDTELGRMTVMGAGGSVDANIDRWIGQFSQPDGSKTKDKAKTEKKTIGGQEVHLVDISGTYKDTPGGPFAGGKAVDRPDYRMLAAIVVTPKSGSYFLKFYGPAKTVAENEKAFKTMIDSLKGK
jgi:hypothetical protein